ncbi:MAG TPA: FAD-dependent oxidoreductase [Terriglobales bacterium]|nr:FAD-dependent oxidoreductase [Terriglobales bacterium]
MKKLPPQDIILVTSHMHTNSHIAVIGAGAFGGWTALYLRRRGAKVTLIDAWGPGNSRSSSGGETRIIRGTYGPNQPYTKMAARALRLWTEHETRWARHFFHRTGVLWMATSENDQYERSSLPMLREAGIAYEELSGREVGKRWPQINVEDVRWAIYESESGFLAARTACQAVVEGFLSEGGEYKQVAVLPRDLETGIHNGLMLSDGSRLTADRYVFACGPWLGQLFPETIGARIRPTKQDVFFFGAPAGDDRFAEPNLPVWADNRDRFIYGIPAADGRGFKVADDTRGPDFDPTSGERTVSEPGLKATRDYLAFRFPAMKDAPLIETRVCQYENSPDNHLIIDRHPNSDNVWLVGGGSGHGFKHGPALGEMVSEWVIENKNPGPIFQLSRFGK